MRVAGLCKQVTTGDRPLTILDDVSFEEIDARVETRATNARELYAELARRHVVLPHTSSHDGIAETSLTAGEDDDERRQLAEQMLEEALTGRSAAWTHRSTTAALLGNIAYRTGRTLRWDAKAERFTNNDAANKLLSYKYRAPYKLTV